MGAYDQYGGLSPEEYDEAMQAFADENGPEWPPSEEDDMGMFVDHVISHVIPEGHEHPFTAESWAEIADGMDTAYDMSEKYPSALSSRYKAAMDQFARAYGFAAERGADPREWADERVREACYYEGVDYGRLRGDNARDNGIAIREPLPECIEDVPFDKMLDFRMDCNEPWSKADGEMLNKKILKTRDDIEDVAYRMAQEHDMMEAKADSIDYVRQHDGINGDEPNLPWHVADKYAYGKSSDELHAEADEYGENIGHVYEDNMRSLYAAVYAYDSRDFEALPASTVGDCRMRDLRVSRATYDELGDGYSAFYQEKMQGYAKRQADRANDRRTGIDFSRGVIQMAVPADQRSRDRQADAARMERRANMAQARLGQAIKTDDEFSNVHDFGE